MYREIIAQARLGNVNIRGRVLLAAIAPGEIPVIFFNEGLIWIVLGHNYRTGCYA
jgi:hypothetical protein